MIKRPIRNGRPHVDPGRDRGRDPARTRRRPVAAEPTLAAPEGRRWRVRRSSEDPRHGGCAVPEPETEADNWRLTAHAAIVMMPAPAVVDEHRDWAGAP